MIKSFLKKILDRMRIVSGTINLNDRRGALHKAWGHIFSNHLLGDYVEFGVYYGDSLNKSIIEFKYFKRWLQNEKKSNELWRQEVAKKSLLNQKIFFHGLDTFTGMPDNNEQNYIFKKGTFTSDYQVVFNKLKKITNNFFLYKGLFNDCSKNLHQNLNLRKIAIVNIDCDIYKSTIDALNIIDGHLQIGSLIMFDDFNAFNADNNKGQRKAFNEYSKSTIWKLEPFFNYMYCGKCFLVVDKKNYNNN